MNKIDEYRNYTLKEEAKLEAILNAIRGTWSDGSKEFADRDIARLEAMIGSENIVSAIKDGRLSVTKPELEGKRRIYGKTYTATQDFVMAIGRSSEAWELEEREH